MAQADGAVTGQKRGSARFAKNETPAAKKAKTSNTRNSTPLAQSPVAASPEPEEQVKLLPSRVSSSRPLPSLAEHQVATVSDEDYQSIASSAVLQTSLNRSRQRWVNNGVFERYWIKPETGKNARKPPPGNPETNWMKGKGQCRIRIEPHIFEAELFVEEKVKPPPPPKQYVPPKSAFGQPYRPQQAGSPYLQQQHSQTYQNRTIPPYKPGVQGSPAVQPSPNQGNKPIQAQPAPPRPQAAPAPAPQDKKPDPVISLLAARASSDQSLKTLMKEVATGNATQEQLRVFQRHIDELTKIIQEDKKKEEAKEQKAAAATQAAAAKPTPIQKFEPSRSVTPVQQPGQPPIQPAGQPPVQQPIPRPAQATVQPIQQAPRPYVPSPQPVLPYAPPPAKYTPTQPPPPPPSLPVVLGFITPGSTDDRFLFPRHGILEALSPQHLLVSFIATRKGSEAADTTGLDPEKTYWSPVTMMVEVAYGREELMNHIRRWVKSPEEVTKHMEETMATCTRAPEAHLAFRLPYKGSALAEDESMLRDESPVAEEKPKPKRKSGVTYIKKAAAAKADEVQPAADGAKAGGTAGATPADKPAEKTGETPTDKPADASADKPADKSDAAGAPEAANAEKPADGSTAAVAPAPTVEGAKSDEAAVAGAEKPAEEADGGRPKRSTRKSGRISTA